MQGIKDKFRLAIVAGMDGDDLAATGDLDAVDISFRQNLLMGNGPIDTALRSGFDCSGRLS